MHTLHPPLAGYLKLHIIMFHDFISFSIINFYCIGIGSRLSVAMLAGLALGEAPL